MTALEILKAYKKGEGYAGTDFDAVILQKIGTIQSIMTEGGATAAQLETRNAAECIMRGVSDIWRQDKPELSPLFYILLGQVLAGSKVETQAAEDEEDDETE